MCTPSYIAIPKSTFSSYITYSTKPNKSQLSTNQPHAKTLYKLGFCF